MKAQSGESVQMCSLASLAAHIAQSREANEDSDKNLEL